MWTVFRSNQLDLQSVGLDLKLEFSRPCMPFFHVMFDIDVSFTMELETISVDQNH